MIKIKEQLDKLEDGKSHIVQWKEPGTDIYKSRILILAAQEWLRLQTMAVNQNQNWEIF